MVKQASHKRQDSRQVKARKKADHNLVALVQYLAEWSAEQDFEQALNDKETDDTNKQESPE